MHAKMSNIQSTNRHKSNSITEPPRASPPHIIPYDYGIAPIVIMPSSQEQSYTPPSTTIQRHISEPLPPAPLNQKPYVDPADKIEGTKRTRYIYIWHVNPSRVVCTPIRQATSLSRHRRVTNTYSYSMIMIAIISTPVRWRPMAQTK